ncbi:MAG TPA: L,D-transpeptidase family protein [Chthoniobacteraceae bacterium]|nr:L,D-transpeptidase family protein [Chthoniobacteraceae bacterium]
MVSFPSKYSRIALAAVVLCGLGALSWCATHRARPARSPENERVAAARAKAEPRLRELCRAAELSYPPDAIYLRIFKQEAELEVWARMKHQPFRLLMTVPILKSSGAPGPKRKEGDRQVPEGFYAIDRFNPDSEFHLSMRIDYPNASDRILSDREKPGGDIYIHGSNLTIGCVPLGDEKIEELFILGLDTRAAGQSSIPVHLFPARPAGEKWDAFYKEYAESNPDLANFWKSLKTAYDAFEQNREVPKMKVEKDGSYRLER